jgi:hypothetical protein
MRSIVPVAAVIHSGCATAPPNMALRVIALSAAVWLSAGGVSAQGAGKPVRVKPEHIAYCKRVTAVALKHKSLKEQREGIAGATIVGSILAGGIIGGVLAAADAKNQTRSFAARQAQVAMKICLQKQGYKFAT